MSFGRLDKEAFHFMHTVQSLPDIRDHSEASSGFELLVTSRDSEADRIRRGTGLLEGTRRRAPSRIQPNPWYY